MKEQVDGAVAVAEPEDVAQLLACGTRALVNDGDLRAGRLLFEAAYRMTISRSASWSTRSR